MIETCEHNWRVELTSNPATTIYRYCTKCDLKIPIGKDEMI